MKDVNEGSGDADKCPTASERCQLGFEIWFRFRFGDNQIIVQVTVTIRDLVTIRVMVIFMVQFWRQG